MHAVAGVQVTMVLCVVYGCAPAEIKISFFRILRVISNKGEELCRMSKKCRYEALAAISRVGLTEKILKNDGICSRHYISGKPADLLHSPDWLPSLHFGHDKLRVSFTTATGRWERRKAR